MGSSRRSAWVDAPADQPMLRSIAAKIKTAGITLRPYFFSAFSLKATFAIYFP
jgi:hypothetical protein